MNDPHTVVLRPDSDIGELSNDDVKYVCRIGRREDTCIYVVMDRNGFGCAKFSSLHDDILARKNDMNAKREGNCVLMQ